MFYSKSTYKILIFITALEVSGEAIEAEFENWLRSRITKKDYTGDMERLIGRLRRKFKEDKKDCGLPPRLGSKTWNIQVPRLRKNDKKGFESGCLKVDWYASSLLRYPN